jgi:hypothetical protein
MTSSKQLPQLLATDRNRPNLELLATFLDRSGHLIHDVQPIEVFEPVLTEFISIELALVDVSGFDRHFWKSCDQPRAVGISSLILSSRQSTTLQRHQRGGVHRLLIKPLVIQELLKLPHNRPGSQS